MDSFDAYGPNSQALTFFDPEENDLIGGDTQGPDFECENFTLPSQTQATQLDQDKNDIANDLSRAVTNLSFKDDFDQINLATVPEHACAYCGIHDPACVVFCNKTSKWFCNGRGNTSGSHIVNHLVRVRAREVTLHKDGPLKDTVLECYICGSKNVFALGFVPAKSESVVVLLCRTVCANQNKDMYWDPAQWQPIIQGRQFLPWLVKVPSEEEQAKSRQLSAKELNQLEEMWKENPQAVLGESQTTEEVQPLLLVYPNWDTYWERFYPILGLECCYQKALKESQVMDNVPIRWETSLNRNHLGFFRIMGAYGGPEMRIAHGDKLTVHLNKQEEPLTAIVIKIPDNFSDEAGLELQTKGSSFTEASICTIKFVWRSCGFDRMYYAIKSFLENKSLCSRFRHRLLGHVENEDVIPCSLPKRYSAPGLPELDHSQVFAVKTVLQRSLSLIQGPPGTGKTVTSASIVYHLNEGHSNKILVVAPSNTAVDHLCEKISLTGLKVVRLSARTREALASSVSHLMIHTQALQLKGHTALRKLHQLKEETGGLTEEDGSIYKELRFQAEVKLLEAADVVCCTCVTAGDRRLKGLRFHAVLVDEATQATEPECLIPLQRNCERLVLVGDHCQLGPTVLCIKGARAGLTLSLFERLVLAGIRPIRLQVQYRMHPALSVFPSNVFYEGSLQNGVTAEDRHQQIDFPWPNTERPTFFYCTTGQEEISGNGCSYLNRAEAATVEKILTKMLRIGVHPQTIGVIAPYEGQRAYLVYYLHHSGSLNSKLYQEVEIASVDSFQGREKDYVILSCVRASEKQGIGFLGDPRRLNVALTRARCGLILVGNPKALCKNSLWNQLLHFYRDQHLLLEGPLNNLSEYMLQFPKPKFQYRFQPGRSWALRLASEMHKDSDGTMNGTGAVRLMDCLQSVAGLSDPALFYNILAAANFPNTHSHLAAGLGSQSAAVSNQQGARHAAAYAIAAAAVQQNRPGQNMNPQQLNSGGGPHCLPQPFFDRIGYIGPSRQFASTNSNLPIPLGMLMHPDVNHLTESNSAMHAFSGKLSNPGLLGSAGMNMDMLNASSTRAPGGPLPMGNTGLHVRDTVDRRNAKSTAGGRTRKNHEVFNGDLGVTDVGKMTTGLLSQPGLSDFINTQGGMASQTRNFGLSGLSQESTSLDFGLGQGRFPLGSSLLSQDSTYQSASAEDSVRRYSSQHNTGAANNAVNGKLDQYYEHGLNKVSSDLLDLGPSQSIGGSGAPLSQY